MKYLRTIVYLHLVDFYGIKVGNMDPVRMSVLSLREF